MKLGPFSFGMLCLAEQCSVSCSQMGVCLWVIMSDVTSLLLAGLVVVRQSFLSEMDWIDLPKFHQHDSHQRAESLLCASRKIYIIISIVWILILPYLLFHIPGHVFVFVFGCLQVPQTCGVIFGNFFSPGSISFHVLKRPRPKGVLVKFRRLVLSVCARCVLIHGAEEATSVSATAPTSSCAQEQAE